MKCNKAENIFNVEVNEETLQRHVSIGTSWESTLLDISNAQLLPNQLLLSMLGTRQANGLQNVYSFLATLQAQPVGDAIDLKFNSFDVAERILKSSDSKLFQRLRRLIHIADMGIEDITMQNIVIPSSNSRIRFQTMSDKHLSNKTSGNLEWYIK